MCFSDPVHKPEHFWEQHFKTNSTNRMLRGDSNSESNFRYVFAPNNQCCSELDQTSLRSDEADKT